MQLSCFCFRTVRFKTFPEYLVVQLRKFTICEDWTPKKLGTSRQSVGNINLNYLSININLKSFLRGHHFKHCVNLSVVRKFFFCFWNFIYEECMARAKSYEQVSVILSLHQEFEKKDTHLIVSWLHHQK